MLTSLRISIATIFAYLTLKDGVLGGNTLYAILFALLTMEYVAELILERRKGGKG